MVEKRPIQGSDSMTWTKPEVDQITDNYDTSHEICRAFSERWSTRLTGIGFETIKACAIYPSDQGHRDEDERNWNLVEPYLMGQWVKWTTIFGKLNQSQTEQTKALMQALTHFSWAHSKKCFILIDLQGVDYTARTDDKHFMLSDPVLASVVAQGGLLGPTDVGAAAINNFFFSHHTVCNEFCDSSWPRPYFHLPDTHYDDYNTESTVSMSSKASITATVTACKENSTQVQEIVRALTEINPKAGQRLTDKISKYQQDHAIMESDEEEDYGYWY